MGALANLTTDESIKGSKDVVGGGYAPKPSGVYDATIKAAYLTKSTGGATAVNLIAVIGDSEYRETALDRELSEQVHKMSIPEKQKLLKTMKVWMEED